MHFDTTINLGNILTIIGGLGTLAALHMQNIRRLDKIEARVEVVYQWFVKNVINATRRSQSSLFNQD